MDKYIERRALATSDAKDTISEVDEEYPELPEFEKDDSEPEEPDVEYAEPNDAVAADFHQPVEKEEQELDYSQRLAHALTDVSVDTENEGVEFGKNAEETKHELEQLEKVNEYLSEEGSNRRYVPNAARSPDTAYVYEDDVAKYYYETEHEFTPSDIAAHVKSDTWSGMSEDEQLLSVIKTLADHYPELTRDATSVEKATTFLNRVLKTEDEVVRDWDAFSLDKYDRLVTLLAVEDRE